MTGLRRFLVYWLPVLLWMTMILLLSSRSDLGRQASAATGDAIRSTTALAKTAHVVEYSVLAMLLFRAATASGGGLGMSPARAAVWSVVAATTFGAADEFRQSFVPNREPRLSDIALDGVSALGAVAVMVAGRRIRDGQRAGWPAQSESLPRV